MNLIVTFLCSRCRTPHSRLERVAPKYDAVTYTDSVNLGLMFLPDRWTRDGEDALCWSCSEQQRCREGQKITDRSTP